MTARSNLSIRLSDEERAFLARHGRQLAEQLRRDIRLLEAILGVESATPNECVTIKSLRRLIKTTETN